MEVALQIALGEVRSGEFIPLSVVSGGGEFNVDTPITEQAARLQMYVSPMLLTLLDQLNLKTESIQAADSVNAINKILQSHIAGEICISSVGKAVDTENQYYTLKIESTK